MEIVYLISRYRMKMIVKAAYYILLLKEALLTNDHLRLTLSLIKENTKHLDDLKYTLLARRAILEAFVNKQIQFILLNYKCAYYYTFTHISKHQLRIGYINLSSTNGEDNKGDKILDLCSGTLYTLRDDFVKHENALKYHGIIKE